MITSTKAGAERADPKKILAGIMATKNLNGIPVLVIDTDKSTVDPDRIERYVAERLADYEERAARALRTLFDKSIGDIFGEIASDIKIAGAVMPSTYFSDSLRIKRVSSFKFLNFDIPYAITLPDAAAAIVVAPARNYGPETMLKSSMGLTRTSLTPLATDNTPFHVYDMLHEFTHVMGGKEPQADKIAALRTRKLFASDVMALLNADLRAVTEMRRAVGIATDSTQDKKKSTIYLEDYGWQMVEANDQALALPPERVDAMTDRDIIDACLFEHFEQSTDLIMAFARIAASSGDIANDILSDRMADVVEGALRMEKIVAAQTDDPALNAMAKRFSLAAWCIDQGQDAYRIKPDAAPATPGLNPV